MSTRQDIFNLLRETGLTVAGALGLMGNWDCESNLEPCRVQGDFNPFRTASKNYVAQITSGAISKEQFMRDAKGFGLAQWTYFTRKGQLYTYWKNSGAALDDAEMQTRFALYELSTGGEYGGLYHILKTSDDLLDCVTKACTIYERPAVNNIDARYAAAQRLAQQIDTSGQGVNTYPAPETPANGQETASDEKPAAKYWPPRGYFGGDGDPGLCKGMSGSDVELLCALLRARGYDLEIDDTITDEVAAQLTQFQKDKWLAADGICGKNSWRELLTV